MQLLISDANILIDLEEGRILELIFKLPYEFRTLDILFFEELQEQHPDLPDQGLQLGGLKPESIEWVSQIVQKYTRPSRMDCMALALARQEQCPLLTGDKALRLSAEQEGVIVKGTIWLMEQLVRHQYISIEQARQSYQQMQNNGRRLPFDEAFRRLNQLSGK